ncbi:MAG: MBL fold metallo-hydrolase [Mycobacterium sp.]|nr:MBL fold metallo-hydrolase [Mycobacterium sp.]
MAPVLTAVTDQVYLSQTPLVNWTLVTDDTGVLLIDAGYPGSRTDVLRSLDELGFGPDEVRAIVLTHAHIDHLGSAIWFAKTLGTPVYCHADEVGHAKREYLQQVSPEVVLSHAWRPSWLKWSLEAVAKGGMVREGIPGTQALTPEVAATLPGQPKAIPTPGHTAGHCSYVIGRVLVAGDALITGHPLARRSGPQVLPEMFNHDEAQYLDSLGALAAADTDKLIPGHGDLWIGPVREAVRQAQPA